MKAVLTKVFKPSGQISCGGKKLTLIAALMLYLLGIAPTDTGAQPPTLSEYEIKAAFLYNFAKFVEWPAKYFSNASKAFRLCIADANLIDDAFATIRGAAVKGRELEIKEYRGIEDLESCHILFVTRSRDKDLAGIIAAATHNNVLTVGETKGFTQQGGIINFILVEKKVRFEINIDAAKRSGLKISSKLLSLAKIVKESN